MKVSVQQFGILTHKRYKIKIASIGLTHPKKDLIEYQDNRVKGVPRVQGEVFSWKLPAYEKSVKRFPAPVKNKSEC